MSESIRSIKQVIDTVDVQMGPITLGQPLPTSKVKQISPFLLLHHLGPIKVTPGKSPMEIGAHPHRGFAPVTFVFSGEVSHGDSLGNHRVVKSGGVQWMSAGSGIVHSEDAGAEFVDRGGEFEIIQLWVNLPSALKMSPPSYQPFDVHEIPVYEAEGVQLNVISGNYRNLQGPVQHPFPITAYTLKLSSTGAIEIPTNQEWNFLIYQLGGITQVNDTVLKDRQLAYFNYDGTSIQLKGIENSCLLLVSAASINEPLAQYGPFVMNNPEELNQAIDDYQQGKMGTV